MTRLWLRRHLTATHILIGLMVVILVLFVIVALRQEQVLATCNITPFAPRQLPTLGGK